MNIETLKFNINTGLHVVEDALSSIQLKNVE